MVTHPKELLDHCKMSPTKVLCVCVCVCVHLSLSDWGYKRETESDGLCVRDPDIDLEQATCNGTHLVVTKG